MVHPIHLDDNQVSVKEIRRYKRGVCFENPVGSNIVPEGYMTVEEFRAEAKSSLTKLLNEHGIH